MSTHSDIDRVFSNARNRINLDLAEFEREFRAATKKHEAPRFRGNGEFFQNK